MKVHCTLIRNHMRTMVMHCVRPLKLAEKRKEAFDASKFSPMFCNFQVQQLDRCFRSSWFLYRFLSKYNEVSKYGNRSLKLAIWFAICLNLVCFTWSDSYKPLKSPIFTSARASMSSHTWFKTHTPSNSKVSNVYLWGREGSWKKLFKCQITPDPHLCVMVYFEAQRTA